MKQWIRSKRRLKKLLMARKKSITIYLQSLIEDGIVNFTILCMQLVGYFLNLEFFYSNPNIEMNNEVLEDLYKYIDRLSENDEFVDHIHNEFPIYKRARGMFDFLTTVRKRTTMTLVIILILMHMNNITTEWWKMYGAHTPHLQNIVIKILSKKRSRLEYQKLQDLIYVEYNQALHEATSVVKDIGDSNEWIVGELDGEGEDAEDAEDELIFDDDVLTSRNVASATRTFEPLKYTRRQTQMQSIVVASTSIRRKKEKEWLKKRMKMNQVTMKMNQVKMKGRKSTILNVMRVMKTMT
ncbi:hypothetical protein CR513_39108, partial [Mucuna pruriens]